jgi:hypothetical protein
VDSADATTVRLLHHLAAAAASDQTLAYQIRDRFLVTRRAALGQIMHRAVARDEITSGYAALAMDLIYGSMWYRLIIRVGPPDYTWADQVATAIASHRPATPGGSHNNYQHPLTGAGLLPEAPNDQFGAG